MWRRWIGLAAVLLAACAPNGGPVADWFSEDFGLGSPLRDPVGTGASDVWHYYDGGHTSQYTKLVQAQDSTTPIEVDDDAGEDGGPALVSQNTTSGVTRYATFAIRGTAGARQLTDPGVHVLDFDVTFIGANYENLNIDLYSCVSMDYYDLGIRLKPVGLNFVAYVEYVTPNGVNFEVSSNTSSNYVIGSRGVWRDGALWHHVTLRVRPGTVTTWTPGVFVGDNNYTGGTLAVASDGEIVVELDGVEVLRIDDVPLILNFDGQSADESSPGAWAPDSRGTEAFVNTLSLIDLKIISGSAVLDNIRLGPGQTWVPVRDWVEQEIPSSAFPGGVARILGDLWSEDPGGSPLPTLQARLYNLTDGVSVGESAEVQAADPAACDFSVTLTPGTKRYRAEVTSDPPEVDIFFSSRGVGP